MMNAMPLKTETAMNVPATKSQILSMGYLLLATMDAQRRSSSIIANTRRAATTIVGSLNSGHVPGTLVPVEEPSTASKADIGRQLSTLPAFIAHEEFGQNVRETFHRADVFIDGLSRPEMEKKIDRFVQAFFG
jgi:hypothetical protein